MPTNKDFKRLVRQRMADTGERYTDARAALVTDVDPSPSPRPQLRERWMELLGDPKQNQYVFRLLKELPPDELRPLAVAGTRHDNPKVRRRSCQLLDDLALTPESIAALEVCTADPDPRVRGAALHCTLCRASTANPTAPVSTNA